MKGQINLCIHGCVVSIHFYREIGAKSFNSNHLKKAWFADRAFFMSVNHTVNCKIHQKPSRLESNGIILTVFCIILQI